MNDIENSVSQIYKIMFYFVEIAHASITFFDKDFSWNFL